MTDVERTAFRREARAWLEANAPTSIRGDRAASARFQAGEKPTGDHLLWKQRMAEIGWGVPTWPKVYGGGGLSREAAAELGQELELLELYNPIMSMGVMMLGPTLLEFGSEDQKQRHLPPIARGEVRWCQGYSEPGAGSDLASLQMRCEDAGDHWVINGQKTWTSGAQWADWCFCLVRTDRAKKHEGISFVLIDLRQPGVEVRPIKLIGGASPFCETFFTDVRLEKYDMVGPLNGGWTIGKRLLQHERANQGGARLTGAGGVNVADLAKVYVGVDDAGRISDPDLRMRIALQEMDARIHALTVQRAAGEARDGAGPSAATSIMKNSATRVGQDRAELVIETLGAQGLGWDGEGFTEPELAAVRAWLSGKATTIFGGSQEIQNNIVAKRILGLPDPAGSVSESAGGLAPAPTPGAPRRLT
jgi:alkylation response protein AidB-like acyl-CoA dehydrogenase